MARKAINTTTKRKVWDKCRGRCWYCGTKVIRPFYHFDHFYPHSRGGEDTVENLVVACIPCNRAKRNTTVGLWRVRIQRQMGLAMSKAQVKMLKSEGIDPIDDPFSWEPPIVFFFERNIPARKLYGDYPVRNIIRFKGWSE